ncbi:MAG TPA: putative LPS assembly protein LptD, partial [Paludibacter sp.]|nr:putative LPS assembly protein LptD [Paludibacter sp.]
PFKRKKPIGPERWYEKISLSYSGTLANSINTKEYKLLNSSFTRDWRNGMKHSIPVGASFSVLKYINVSPSFNYNERWYFQSINQSWDKAKQRVVNDTTYGFHRVFDFNTGVSASTTLYGYYIPIRSIFGDKVDRIRHVVTPSIGFSYQPDFGAPLWGYYSTYTQSVVDPKDPNIYHDQQVQYSHYIGSLYSTPSVGKSGSINFSLGNNIEMKVRNDKDTTGLNAFKKISLIDNFSVGGSYNLAADSMQWSPLNANLRLKLGNYSLSLSGAFDPYMYGLNSSGRPVHINKLRWENGKFPRFLGTSTSYSYTISNETFKKKDKKTKSGNTDAETEPTLKNKAQSNESLDEKSKNKVETTEDGYQKVSIPWSISASYTIQYGDNTEVFNNVKMEYGRKFTQNLSLSGNISLTSNWKISATTSFDFEAKQFTYTNMNVTRNLHCWSMSASIVPFGVYKTYNFRIGVNASMLQDLKYDRQSNYGGNNINWY